MDKIRQYGIVFLGTFVVMMAFAILEKDDLNILTSRLVFMAWFAIPILMIVLGGSK